MSLMMPAARDTLVGNALALKATYTRMNRDILRVVHAIPIGRVTTIEAISRFLDVPAHHVAFLLSRRYEAEREAAPWHRVIAHRGAVGRPLFDAQGRTQVERLTAEGVDVGYRGRVGNFATCYFEPTIDSTGVVPGNIR